MHVHILHLFRKILCYPFRPIIFPIFSIARFGISVLFRYFGFVSVNLGTAVIGVCAAIRLNTVNVAIL